MATIYQAVAVYEGGTKVPSALAFRTRKECVRFADKLCRDCSLVDEVIINELYLM